MMTGLAFMLLIQMIVTWLDQPGHFVILQLMIFQLASSAGTYPHELLHRWAKAMHPWLPMTYSILGFRNVISSGDYGALLHQVGYLCIYIIVSVILNGAFFLTRIKRTVDERLMPVKV